MEIFPLTPDHKYLKDNEKDKGFYLGQKDPLEIPDPPAYRLHYPIGKPDEKEDGQPAGGNINSEERDDVFIIPMIARLNI